MKKRFTEEQIINILKEQEAGFPVKEITRRHGFAGQIFYRWKSKFGGMEVSVADQRDTMIGQGNLDGRILWNW